MKNTIVDIVIPIYKDFEATKNCLESVLKYSDKSQRLILINDNSPEDEIVNYLKKVAESNQSVTLIEHSKNLGFVKTVNEGMNYSKDHDVILLNSDTVVTRNWVNKLKKKAYIRDNIATVTPFSNSATMFSYPISNNTNKLPNEKNPEEVNELFEKVNYSDDLIEVPTGHGFCLYITRKAIQQVGLFDAETFGKGYGEENDFCQRAKQCGFINVPAFDCFIYHKDGASFGTGSERDRMRELTMEKLLQLHPSYIHQLEEFMLEDPFRTFRALLDFELIKEDTKPKILYVGHNWGGGTQTHLMEMAMAAIKHDWIPFVLKPNGNSLYLESPAYPNFQLMFSSEDKLEELTTTLKAIGINHLHFQHLINLPNEILQLPEKLSVAYDITLHDYYLACPRINLLKNGNEYCGTNTNEKICNQCLGTADSIASWRENNLKILDGARVISTPSKACADILHKYFPKLKINVIPHPFANFSGKEKILNIGEKINVAVVGMIGEHKGMNILKTCSEYSKEKDLPINWFVIGSTIDDKTLSNVVISGNYSSREELARKLEEYKIDLVFFPSIWPETFSYVISEAWSAGLPVLSADLGAQGERIKETGAGWLVKSLEAKTVCDQILEIKNDSTLYRKALGNIKNYKPDSEIDWKGYYQGLTIEKKGKINIPKEITGIIKVASKLSNFEKYQEVINNQEKTISTLDKMYFSQTAKYEEILNSRGWTFIKYIRTIHYPKEFMSQTIYYLKKLLKKVLPKFLWNFLRSIRNYLAELKFDLSLMMIKRKLKTEGQKIVISVAMPVYDRTTELEEAIQSVLHQTFQAFELIIVTDGSPAETLAVIEKYKNHPKVRVFEYGDNTGNSVRGRNKAILEARGKYLAFLDSDDISMPTRLADTVAIFEKNGS